MPIERVKLNYRSAVSKTPPVEKTTVSSSHIEELNAAIRKKCEQNAINYIASYIASCEDTSKCRANNGTMNITNDKIKTKK